jgi:hypothetical protein
MKTIRWPIILVTFLLSTGFTNDESWVIDRKSTLAIHGTTNINSFTCKLGSYSGHDTLSYVSNHDRSRLVFTANHMIIPIHDFNCGAPQISRDFYKTLKSDTYPELEITFISLENACVKNNTRVNGVLDITLAGTTVRYSVRFTLNVNSGTMLLSGMQTMKFTDFKLKAPEKFKGLIRVQDGLSVDFHLVLKVI